MRKVKVLGRGQILIGNMLLNEMLSELRMIVSNYDVNSYWHRTINSTLVYEVCIGTFCCIFNTAKLVDHNYIATVNNTFSYFIFKLNYLS